MRWVVPVLICPVLSYSVLLLPLEAKLLLITISSTILTMEEDWSRLGFELWLLTRILSQFLSLLSNTFPHGTHKSHRFFGNCLSWEEIQVDLELCQFCLGAGWA
jgi:hypothetical protein